MTTNNWLRRVVSVHKQIQSCDSKITFSTKGKAMIFVDKKKKRSGCQPYQCPICGDWHLASR